MIDRERWLEALQASAFEEAGYEGESAGFHIPSLGSLVLHEHDEQSASLMRLVYEEAARDAEELTNKAQQLEDYALRVQRARQAEGKEEGCLPLYASATPGGRLVANFCACSPFDETDDALATLHKFLSDNPLGRETARL